MKLVSFSEYELGVIAIGCTPTGIIALGLMPVRVEGEPLLLGRRTELDR